LEIRQLNTFLKLASVLNFTQAGRELGYSQPNISMQIQQLEQEIGAPLFNRIGRHISLTQYGEELLPYARQIVATAERMESFLKSEDMLGGTLRFGIVDSLCTWVIDRLLIQYHKRFPKVQIEVTVGTAAMLKDCLERGMLDVACLIDELLPAERWNCWHLLEVPIVVLANRNGELAKKASLALCDLANEEFILTEDTIAYSEVIRRRIEEIGGEFHVVAKIPSANQVCKIVAQENFLSLLPACNARLTKYHDGLASLRVTDFQETQYVQIIHHPNKVLVPQVEGLMEELRKVIDDVVAT